VLFDENQQHSNPSQPVPSMPTQTTRDPHQVLPLHFGAQQTAVSSSMVSNVPASSLPPEGSHAIAASSPGNFEPSSSLLHDCLQDLNRNTTHPNSSLDENQIVSRLFTNSKCYKCFEPQTKKFIISRHVLFDENQQHSNPSQPVPSMPTQTTRDPHQVLPLHFGAQQTVVSSSMVSNMPASSLPPEGSHAIDASSPGNFGPSGSLLHDCLQDLNRNTTHPNSSLDENQIVSSLNLQSQSHDFSTATHLSPDLPLPNPNFTNSTSTTNPPQRTHNMTTRSINQIFKPKQIHTVSKYPLPQTIEPTCVSQAIS
jgi:hypothetical protein